MSSHDVSVRQLRCYPVWTPDGDRSVWMNVNGDCMGRVEVWGTTFDERIWLMRAGHRWMIVGFATEDFEKEWLEENAVYWPERTRLEQAQEARDE